MQEDEHETRSGEDGKGQQGRGRSTCMNSGWKAGHSPSMQQGQMRQRQQQQKAWHSPSMANEPAKLTQVLWASSKASPSSTSTRMMSAIHSFTFPKVPCQTM